MKNILLFVIIVSLFCSCDTDTSGVAYIRNESSSTIYLIGADRVDTLLSKKNQTYNSGQGIGFGQDPAAFVHINTIKSDRGICKKDIKISANWVTSKVSKSRWEHTFVVNDTDF